MSIRNDIYKDFKFPARRPLTKRLKDVLETEVDEKYYLSDAKIDMIAKWKCFEKPLEHIMDNESVSGTITTRSGAECGGMKLVYDDYNGKMRKDQDTVGTLTTNCGASAPRNGWKIVEPFIAASRGRNPDNPSDRTKGAPTEQRLEPKTDGTTNTITSVQKDNYVVEPKIVEDFYKNRPAREYDKVAPTLRSERVGLKVKESNLKTKLCNKLVEKEVVHGGEVVNHSYTNSEQRDTLDKYIESKNGIMPTVTTRPDCLGYVENEPSVRIRKLTPKECWRLMAFDDEDFEKAEKAGVSNSQLYKQAGNSIVVKVLEGVLGELIHE